jgi:hypothetical protein
VGDPCRAEVGRGISAGASSPTSVASPLTAAAAGPRAGGYPQHQQQIQAQGGPHQEQASQPHQSVKKNLSEIRGKD